MRGAMPAEHAEGAQLQKRRLLADLIVAGPAAAGRLQKLPRVAFVRMDPSSVRSDITFHSRSYFLEPLRFLEWVCPNPAALSPQATLGLPTRPSSSG